MRKFVAVSAEIIAGQLRFIGSSAGRNLREDNGINSERAIEFLFSLQEIRRWQSYQGHEVVFITYAGTLDSEHYFKDLPASAKNILFAAPKITERRHQVAERLEELRVAVRTLKIKIGRTKTGADAMPFQSEVFDLEAEAAQLRKEKHSLEYVTIGRYTLHLLPGKILTITSKHKSITIYDLFSFWRKPLFKVVREYFGETVKALDRKSVDLPLWEKSVPEKIIEGNKAANDYLVRLADYTAERLDGFGIRLKRWYGASAACNKLLNDWGVRKEFAKLTEHNCNARLWRAIQQAFYGGRLENLKLGTVGRTLVYDINAAYGWAAAHLGQCFDRWQFKSEYDPNEPFSLWYCDHELPESFYTGMMPHRLSSGAVVYRKSGRGWHWQPEVAEMMRRFPNGIKVQFGFVQPYKRVGFHNELQSLYAWRCRLQAANDPFEKIVKLLIASIYGKFAQRVGEATFHNSAWAGWITSYVRAMLTRACEGKEHAVICFMQDAIHSLEPLDVPVSNRFGEWKQSEWDSGLYLASGVYALRKPGTVKYATRGFQVVDFDKAVRELTKTRGMDANREFIVGWRLAQYLTVKYGSDYLNKVSERFRLVPARVRTRSFDQNSIDWHTQILESRLNFWDDGRESAMRRDTDVNQLYTMMLDVLKARRL